MLKAIVIVLLGWCLLIEIYAHLLGWCERVKKLHKSVPVRQTVVLLLLLLLIRDSALRHIILFKILLSVGVHRVEFDHGGEGCGASSKGVIALVAVALLLDELVDCLVDFVLLAHVARVTAHHGWH